MNKKFKINKRAMLTFLFVSAVFGLAACGGGGGGSGGDPDPQPQPQGSTFSASLTAIEFEDTRNGRTFSSSNLPANGATITRN